MSLQQRLVSAVGWLVGIKVGFQVLTWAMTLLVIRVLSPDDYGLMALSQVFVNFLLGFANLGLGDALVQRRDAPREAVASAFGLLILMSAGLSAALALAAYPLADWYGDPRLRPLIQVSALGFLFDGLTTLPRAQLTGSLLVRPMFVMELSSGLVGAVTVISLAFTGHGVWALLLGWVAGNVAKLVGFAVLTADLYVWPTLNLRAVRPLLQYGIYRTLEYTAWAVLTSADLLIVGRLLGAGGLGLYSVALNFAGMPFSKMAPIVNSLAVPAFAMVQQQPAAAQRAAVTALRMVAVLAVPVFFGIAAVAPEVVALVFGPQWAGAERLLAPLSLAITFRPLLLLLTKYLQGIGEARAAFWCTAAGAALLPPAVLLGCWWGIAGACWAWVLCYPAVFLASALIAARWGGLPLAAVLTAPLRPALAGGAMLLAVSALRPALPPDLPGAATLAALVAAGAATYGAGMLLWGRMLLGEFLALARSRR